MNYTRKSFVEFLYPGTLVDESSAKEIKKREPSRASPPDQAFGFRFFDIIKKNVNVNGKDIELKSKRINVSPTYYCGGEVLTLEEVRKYHPDKKILIRNMEGNGYNKVIHCRTGNWKPFREEDVVYPVKSSE